MMCSLYSWEGPSQSRLDPSAPASLGSNLGTSLGSSPVTQYTASALNEMIGPRQVMVAAVFAQAGTLQALDRAVQPLRKSAERC